MKKSKKILIWIILILTLIGISFISYNFYQSRNSLANLLKDNGFAQLKPPNTLVKPGTIVVIDKNNPSVLKIICSAENAFGNDISNRYQESKSTDITLNEELSGDFNLDLSFLHKDTLKSQSKVIRKITLKLSNVAIIELPDDAVYELIKNRSNACRMAIEKRNEVNQKVTLIKKVIRADSEYFIDFANNVQGNTKTDLIKKLSIELGAKSSVNTESKVIGKQLFWGIDDDELLGRLLPDELPSTGSSEKRPRLTNPAQSYKVEYEQISYNVIPIKQPSKMSCWITVYTMMKSWKQQKSLTINNVLGSTKE